MRHPVIRLLGLAAALLTSAAVLADAPPGGTISLVVENDLFADEDKHYTNGVRLSWLPDAARTPQWAERVARLVPWFPDTGAVLSGYAIGQNIYTPRDIRRREPLPDDRPYAGWLYGSVGLGVESGRQLDQFLLTVGVVGPASLAEETQVAMHQLVGAPQPRGWHAQLANELGVILTYQRSWRSAPIARVGRLDLDLMPHLGGAFGNVFTYANAGLTLRLGENLPRDYGPPRIQPGLPGSSYYGPQDGFAWYLFAGLEGRAVGRNIFLDGNSLRDSARVDRKPWVGDLQFGGVLAWRELRLSYTHVLRTREFDGQGKRDSFGALSVSLPF